MPHNPDWTRDELILALDLYLSSGHKQLDRSHPDVIELSETLNRLPLHAGGRRGPDFRNPTGVSMELGNFLTVDPTYHGKGLRRGNRLVQVIWDAFAHDPEAVHRTAVAIRGAATSGGADAPAQAIEQGEEEFREGRILTRLHILKERNASAVRRKKEAVLKEQGSLRCEACNFDFLEEYGELGRGFAECHHRVPLAELAGDHPTRLSHLSIVCANCHRMLHRSAPMLAVEELRELLARIRRNARPMTAAPRPPGPEDLAYPDLGRSTAPSWDGGQA